MQIKKTLYLLSTLTLATVSFTALTACNFGHVKEIEDNVQIVLDETEKYIEQAKIPYKPESTDTVTMKEDIWLGQDSFRITGGEPFPAEMEASDAITLSYAEPHFSWPGQCAYTQNGALTAQSLCCIPPHGLHRTSL